MAAPLAGMTGLYGPADNVPHGSTGRDPSNWGGPADPRHAVWGAETERSYQGTAYEQDPALKGGPVPLGGPRGEVIDRTPSVHSAPYPRHPAGEELGYLEAAEQMRVLHGRDLGAPGLIEDAGTPYPTLLESGRYDSPNASMLAKGTPAQLRNSNDVDQGDGRENGYGFNLGRQFRRWFQDAVPRDWSTLNGGERPFYGRHPVWQARFDGPDSPYAWAGDTSVDMMQAPTPVTDPTPYEQPSNPTVAPTTTYSAEGAISSGWVAG